MLKVNVKKEYRSEHNEIKWLQHIVYDKNILLHMEVIKNIVRNKSFILMSPATST